MLVLPGYDDVTLLGEGGFSRVYRARQTSFDRHVAVKVLQVGPTDERQRSAFERECRAMGVVSQHPNIVTVYSADFTPSGEPCIVMELYGGGTYGDLMKQRGALDVDQLLELGVKMAGALQTAHDRGLLHRDVKPQNLFRSDYGEPALGDFGISTFDDLDPQALGHGLSVHYAAPEVISGDAVGPTADIYSLAATLYTLRAARRPFASLGGPQNAVDVARRVLQDEPPPLGAGTPPMFESALRDALAKDAGERPPTAAAFADSLRAVQSALGHAPTPTPVAALPPADDDLTIDRDEALAGAERDDGTVTIGRSTVRSERAETTQTRTSSRRSAVSVAVAIAAVGGLVVAGVLASDGDEEPPGDGAVTESPTDDVSEFFDRLVAPSGISVSRADDGSILVDWSPVEGAVAYAVRRQDSAAPEGTVVEVTEPPTTLKDVPADQPVCVAVRALGEGGRVSEDSATTCGG